MVPLLVALTAQLFLTNADAQVRRQPRPLLANPIQQWLPTYSVSRLIGLLLRLNAVYLLPVAAASVMFSSSAISISSFVAWKHGEILSKREWLGIALIVLAVVMRSI